MFKQLSFKKDNTAYIQQLSLLKKDYLKKYGKKTCRMIAAKLKDAVRALEVYTARSVKSSIPK